MDRRRGEGGEEGGEGQEKRGGRGGRGGTREEGREGRDRGRGKENYCADFHHIQSPVNIKACPSSQSRLRIAYCKP